MLRIVPLLILLAGSVLAQSVPDEAVLATVGGETITAGEFRGRYALTVFPYKDREYLTPVVKQQFLYSLIAERLLAKEARRLGYATEDRFTRNRRMAEEMFVRDKLFRDSIRSRVSVTREQVYDRFVHEQQDVEYDFLYSTNEAEVRNLYRICLAGVPFDSLLAERKAQSDKNSAGKDAVGEENTSVIDEGAERGQGIQSPVGALLKGLDTLAAGEVSSPIRGEDGWYLLRKIDHSRQLYSAYEFDQQYKRIENALRSESEAKATSELVKVLWEGRSAQIERKPYAELGDRLFAAYRSQSDKGLDMLQPSSELFDSLRSLWSLQLDSVFARIGNERLSIGDALDRLQTFDLRLQKEEVQRFPDLYRQRVRDMLDRFLITRRGYALQLDQSAEVRQSVAMWAANGLAEIISEVLWEQYIANDDSLWIFYTSRPDLFGPPVEVRIIEVLHSDEEVLDDVVKEFDAGVALEDLAASYSQRGGVAGTRGKTDWFSVIERGSIGRTAFGLRIADAAGPLHTEEGHVFMQLLDRRYPGGTLPDWGALRDSVSVRARDGIMRARTEQLLRSLASRESITVNLEALRGIAVRSLQMFTIRYMGFGGKIPAMPSVMPLYESVLEGMRETGMPAP